MIAAILLILYKHINKVSSFRYARKAFIEDIRYFLMEPIIAHCGGDPALIDSYRKNYPHIFCFYQKNPSNYETTAYNSSVHYWRVALARISELKSPALTVSSLLFSQFIDIQIGRIPI